MWKVVRRDDVDRRDVLLHAIKKIRMWYAEPSRLKPRVFKGLLVIRGKLANRESGGDI